MVISARLTWAGMSLRLRLSVVVAVTAILAITSLNLVAEGGVATSPSTVSASLVNFGFNHNVTNYFWGVNAQTAKADSISSDSGVGNLLNNSSVRSVRYGQQTEECDLLNNTLWSAGAAGGTHTNGCPFSIPAFKQWCVAATIQCHSIIELPAEIDNPTLDAQLAKYIVTNLSFQPTFWTVGNEPTGWTHWGKMWWNWKTGDALTPTATQYASELLNVTAAVLAVDPGAEFIGLEAACDCNTAWFTAVAQAAVGHPEIYAIAYHQYPTATQSTTQSDSVFLQPLDNSTHPENLSASYHQVWNAIQCGTCEKSLPIEVDEYNHGSSTTPPPADGQYVNALYTVASIAQAEEVNLTRFVFFDLQTSSTSSFGYSMLKGNDAIDPVGTLYQNLTGSFTPGGSVYNVSVKTVATNVWSSLMVNANNYTLLVANANLTDTLNLSVSGVFPTGGTGTVISWAPSQNAPTVTHGVVIATHYTIPAEGLLFLRVHSTTGPLHSMGAPRAPHFSMIAQLIGRFD